MDYIIKTDDLQNHKEKIEIYLEMMFDSLYEDGEIDNPVQFKVETVNN